MVKFIISKIGDIVNDSININKKNKYLFIIIIVLVVLITGGTLAYLIIDILAYNDKYNTVTTCLEVDYDISNDDGTIPISGDMFPSYSALNGLNGKVGLKIKDNCSLEGIGTLSLNVVTASSTLIQRVDGHCENSKTLETLSYIKSGADCVANSDNIWVSNGTALKYAVYDTDEIVDGVLPVSVGYINKTGKIDIYSDFPVTKNNVNYYIYVWLDGNVSDNSYAGLSFSGNVSSKVVQKPEETSKYTDSILNGMDPELASGMIPVTISNTGVVTTADTTSEWYSYEDKQWANAVLVTSETRSIYINQDGSINANQTIPEENILAYYVWIPKYSYKMNGTKQAISISFNSTPDGYIEHPAFDFDGSISGFWVGKFETTGDATTPTVKPNTQSLRSQNVSTQFQTALKFAGGILTDGQVTFAGNDTYGLISDVDTHMMKNSEWGSVAYLSYSIYGINDEIRINNNSAFTTGCGASEENSGSTTDCQIVYGSVSDGTYPQSTTGNITGVFDMSGGANEYVMGYYSGANSNYASNPDTYFGYTSSSNDAGFSGLIATKYWNEYTSDTSTTACNGGICYGHALSEISGWYDGSVYFVISDYPWFVRGDSHYAVSNAGIWSSSGEYGQANEAISFRTLTIVKEM